MDAMVNAEGRCNRSCWPEEAEVRLAGSVLWFRLLASRRCFVRYSMLFRITFALLAGLCLFAEDSAAPALEQITLKNGTCLVGAYDATNQKIFFFRDGIQSGSLTVTVDKIQSRTALSQEMAARIEEVRRVEAEERDRVYREKEPDREAYRAKQKEYQERYAIEQAERERIAAAERAARARDFSQSGSDFARRKPLEQAGGVAENGDRYNEDNDGDGRLEPVHVKGYTKKDGTRVREHYRARPNR